VIEFLCHHAKPKRASATAPLGTGADPDLCRTGVGAGSSAGAEKEPDSRQSNHEWTDDQAGSRRLTNVDSYGGSLVHEWTKSHMQPSSVRRPKPFPPPSRQHSASSMADANL